MDVKLYVSKEIIFIRKPNMDYRSKFLKALGLILLLFVGRISILKESHVEEKERNQEIIDYDICTVYDYYKVIDNLLFKTRYKPLVVIIAHTFTDGLNRVRNLTQSKRILHDNEIKNNPNFSQIYHTLLENFYLFEAKNIYYFIYPVHILDNLLTIYCQKKLLNDHLGVIFDFINVNEEYPFFEDILIPLRISSPNCALKQYIRKKLQTGESFSELSKLREQLFSDKEKYIYVTAFNNDDICDSIGFNLNSQSRTFLLYFNSLLKQIQNSTESVGKKRSIVERSLNCFQSRHLEAIDDESFKDDTIKLFLNRPMVKIDYLNWLNKTISSLNSNDTSFANICRNRHEIDALDLFCFIKILSGAAAHNITAWINVLQQLVAKSLISQLKWFNSLISVYKDEYLIERDSTLSALQILENQMLNVNENLKRVMIPYYDFVLNLLSEKGHMIHTLMFNSSCFIYYHWRTIDDLLLEVEFQRLVIIVADDIRTGLEIVKQIKTSRVLPKLKREDLHYTKQFLYDVIMKHIHLFQSNDTYYYVYSMDTDRHHDVLITYFEYKMIKDYSKVEFYFANFMKYFPPDYVVCNNCSDLVIPALPDNCAISSKCKKRFLNPSYLIKLHQEFYNRFPQYLPLYATFYIEFLSFINDDGLHHKGNDYINYSQKFYDFLNEERIANDAHYLFKDLPCSSARELNNKINIDFTITEIEDVHRLYNLLHSSHSNIVSINNTDNTNLKSFCSDNKRFKFLQFFCFLRINYIEGMLKVIDQKSDLLFKFKVFAENEKNNITEYLLKVLVRIHEFDLLDYVDYKHKETQILRQSQHFYSGIPEITLNGMNLSNKIYLLIRENTIYLECHEKQLIQH
ncbi:uncharacterized protein LOC122504014 isoform X2 [Leptopilina heterotoma]|uniref:uncharacterized protein LOC122504014 isoform X2 n=1 Tax=Leptopilina heterotoma TaxID=63436 RepID=UPI001CA9EC05|nr:uncharacterized protein LOC122504014 isoform X2 [Leptopilina heterotoma]